jgi:hypothetical protein
MKRFSVTPSCKKRVLLGVTAWFVLSSWWREWTSLRVAEYLARYPNTTKIVWQTWRTGELPGGAERLRLQHIRRHPSHEFRLVSDAEMESWMRENFASTPTLEAFEQLNPRLGAMRADFWRYCVLYRLGGIYLDLDARLVRPLHQWVGAQPILSTEGNDWGKFRGYCEKIWGKENTPERMVGGGNKAFLQWAMVFPTPGHVILNETIRLMTELILDWRDDDTTLRWSSFDKVICLTGPGVYSRAVYNTWNRSMQEGAAVVMGVDYQGRAKFSVSSVDRAMSRVATNYAHLSSTVPIKKKKKEEDGI